MSLHSRPISRRSFLAGSAAIGGAVIAAALGLLAWRKRNEDQHDSAAAPAEEVVGTAGIFGEWLDRDGLPAFRYTLDHRTDPRASYQISDDLRSTLNWHQLGNDATTAIATNDGWVQLFDFSHGSRWMNLWEPSEGRYAGGFGYVCEDGAVASTLFLDADPGATTDRVFGTGYYDTRLEINGLEIDRRVTLPFGDATWLLSRITIRNRSTRGRRLRHFEYWDVNPRWLAFGSTDEARAEAARAIEYDVTPSNDRLLAKERQTAAAGPLRQPPLPRVPPQPGPTLFLVPLGDTPITGFDTDPSAFFGAGNRAQPDAAVAGRCTNSSGSSRPCLVYQSDVDLKPDGVRTLWFAYGYTYGDLPVFPSDPAAEEARSLDQWKAWLPGFTIPDQPDVARELTWHAYCTRASSLYDDFFRRRTIPQGFWYLYSSGFNAGLRDSAQHALPMVYFEPQLARDVLFSIFAQQDQTGHFPYSMTGYGIAYDFIWQPGDHDLWALWIASEYLLATRDFASLDESLSFYPPDASAKVPLWEHLVLSYHHLVNTVGLGQSGLLHARNGDWNDGLAFEAGAADIGAFIRDGESTLASAFAAWVLDRFVNVARERGETAFASEVQAFADGLRERLRSFWNGRWIARAVLPSGERFGDNQLRLEPQPWAILAGVLDDDQADAVLSEVDAQLRDGSPLGARLLAQGSGPRPNGESIQGGVWLSITHTLVWAAARQRPALAWDEFLRNTLNNHTAHYPDIWVGAWSGPDAYNSDWSPRPGWTWDLPALNVHGQLWPIQNVHAHSQPLMSFLRLAGVEPAPHGLRIEPALPFEEWRIDSPSFSLAYSPTKASGRMVTAGSRIELQVHIPKSLAGTELRVTSTAATARREVRDREVIISLEGPRDGAWEWTVERA